MLSDTSPYKGLMKKESHDGVPAAITDIGCERDINEDRYAVLDCAAGRAWIVCDGMGGVVGGELAAQLAIDAIRRSLQAVEDPSPGDALVGAIEEANRVIVLRRQNPAFSSMGTTVVAALIQEDELILGHAGDSRAYLVRSGAIQQLTVDHTYVQDLVEKGMITQNEALSHPQAHVLTRCLGAEPRLELDRQRYWIWDNDESDKLVLCSDGLYSLLSDDEICDFVTRLNPQEACAQMVELAKSRGGFDNITVAVLPLEGQLREEAPANPRSRARKIKVRTEIEEANIPLGRRIAIMFLLALIGSAVSALLVMWKLSSLV